MSNKSPVLTKHETKNLESKIKNVMGNLLPVLGKKPSLSATFRDGEKKVHYIIVVSQETLRDEMEIINTYISSLEEEGLEVETIYSEMSEKLVFIKIHANRDVLRHFAEIFDYELKYQSQTIDLDTTVKFKWMANEITKPNPDSDVYKRAPETLSGEKPKEITSGETSYIIYKALSTSLPGGLNSEYLLDDLLKKGIFKAAYPLHDGMAKWSTEGHLTDRQLLARYWANAKSCYKQQPLNLIEKYFGSELGFYFAWLGFYNKMLIPVSILGVVCFIFGIATISTNLNQKSFEICDSDKILCPRCFKYCGYAMLKTSCLHSNLSYLFDNIATSFLGAVIAVWAMAFLRLWKRQEAMLRLRWNIGSVEKDNKTRPEFRDKAKHFRMNRITNVYEAYVPQHVKCCTYIVAVATIVLLIMVVALFLFAIILYRLTLTYWQMENIKSGKKSSKYTEILAALSASILSVIFIIIFSKMYEMTAIWLTNLENPRTQSEFDNSFIYKCYILAFVNNYAVTFYIAFFKGRFFTHPGKLKENSRFSTDLCDPAGCAVDLFIQLLVIFVVKSLIQNFLEVVIPLLTVLLKKIRLGRHYLPSEIPQWEEDYLLNPVDRYYLIEEYMEMIIQYGFVVFFVAAFPLGPVLALLNNIAEIRTDAKKFLYNSRRPVPSLVSGLGAWNGILQAVTYLGVITNAFVIAFTSNFVTRFLNRFENQYHLEGILDSTLSAYNASALQNPKYSNFTICYYPGSRYPPGHENEYQLTTDHWIEVAVRFAVILIFEHIIMIVMGIMAYAIPDIPRPVQSKLECQETELKALRIKMLNEAHLKKQKRRGRDQKNSFRVQIHHHESMLEDNEA